MSLEHIQLKLKQTTNTKGSLIRGCSLLPDGRMVLHCYSSSTVRFINKDGVELFQIGKDTVYIKDINTVAVSSGDRRDYRCIKIIYIESKDVMTTSPMAWRLEVEQYITVHGIKE